MSKLLDKELYNIRAELCNKLFPKGEHTGSLHENLVLDKVLNMLVWEKRALDLLQYSIQKRTIFPDGGIYFFGRKYYIGEEKLLEIIQKTFEALSNICIDVPCPEDFYSAPENILADYGTGWIETVSARVQDFMFIDGFIIYKKKLYKCSSAKKDFNVSPIDSNRSIRLLLGYDHFEFQDISDLHYLLGVYRAINAQKKVIGIDNVFFEDGYIKINPIPNLNVNKQSRIKYPYSKALYNQHKDKSKLDTIKVAVDNGKIVAFANKGIKQCILHIKKGIKANRYVKSLLKVDSLKSLFEDYAIKYIFDGDETLTTSIKKFRKALGTDINKNSVSVAIEAIKHEAALCRGNTNCIASCRKDFCKFDACFKIMLSHIPKYPVLLFDEPYEYGNGYRYIKNMIITSEHVFNPDYLYIVVKAINETKRKTFQFTVSRHDYYKALFSIYTYFSSEMFWKRKSDYYMEYLRPFGVKAVDVFKY